MVVGGDDLSVSAFLIFCCALYWMCIVHVLLQSYCVLLLDARIKCSNGKSCRFELVAPCAGILHLLIVLEDAHG